MTRKKQKVPSNFEKLSQELGIAPVALYELIHNILQSRGVLDANRVFLWEDIPPEYESLISDFRKYTHIPFWWAKYNELKAQKACSDSSNNASSTRRKVMDFDEYGAEILRISKLYSIPEEKKLTVYALGLPGETGEVCELLKKHIRDGVLDKEALAKELGDVLAYLTLIADSFGFTLEQIAEMNLEKLTGREENGTLHGTGNER